MTNAMEIVSNEGIPALPPLPRVAPVVHAPLFYIIAMLHFDVNC